MLPGVAGDPTTVHAVAEALRRAVNSVDVVGDVAIERLHYSAVATAPSGETTEDVGKGIHSYRRCADGTWQLAQDIWNSDRRPDTASER
jgi:ketosteroid isomerase-like protein